MKTALVWSDAKIVVRHFSADNKADEADAVQDIQDELGAESDDPRWQLVPGKVPVEIRDDEAPDSTLDYETIREIAETEDSLLDSMDYMDPFDVREVCRELMRVRRGKTMSEATVDYLFDKEARDR